MRKLTIKFLILFLSILYSFHNYAQINKGEKYYEKHLWVDALKAYEKELKKDKPNYKVYQHLGEVYLKLNEYEKAEEAFKNAIKKGKLDPIKYLEYGKALLLNGKVDFALQSFNQYRLYAKDTKADKYIATCDSLKKWEQTKPLVSIHEISGGINTPNPEFAPIYYNEGLLYCTTGHSNLVHDILEESRKINYFDVYYAKQQNNDFWNYKAGHIFSGKLVSELHDGPANVSPGETEIYFSRLVRNTKSETMQLYVAKIENGNIKKVEDFFYNNDEYSIIHPAFSESGDMMFFASNKITGGKGGFDIYYCVKLRKFGWSIPKLVPGAVNTEGNELFPYFMNGQLYFSSDGHIGYGGLDIYTALLDEHYKVVYNMQKPMNSRYDDFSLSFMDGKRGYFASNRPGGMGQDDIYGFTLLEQIEDKKLTTMSGTFEYNELPIDNATLILLDENGIEVGRVRTDKYGDFEFQHLDPDKSYSIVPLQEVDGSEIYITNAVGEKVMLLVQNEQMNLTTLPADIVDGLLQIRVDDAELIENGLSGFVYLKQKGDFQKPLKIDAFDSDGNVVASTYLDENGNFKFNKLSPDKAYLIKVKPIDEGMKLEILKPVKGGFNYTTLKAISVNGLTELELNDPNILNKPVQGFVYDKLKGDLSVLPTVNAYDNTGQLIETAYVNSDGEFVFMKLNPDMEYILKVEEIDEPVNLEVIKLESGFKYSTLKSMNVDGLATIEVTDSEVLKTPLDGFIYTKLKGDYSEKLEIEAYDDEGNLIETTFSDNNGNFTFTKLSPDKSYLIKLKEGTSDIKMEIITKRYGGDFNFQPLQAEKAETMLPIEVVNPTLITMELKGYVYNLIKGDFRERLELTAYDDFGNILARTYLKKDGSFNFGEIPPQHTYVLKLPKTNEELQLAVVDNGSGDLILTEKEGENEFRFNRLAPEDAYIRIVNEEGVVMKIKQGETFSASRIHYEYDSAELTADAKNELNKLIIIMKRNYHINVDLSAHTDTRGDAKYNQKLSDKRAKAVIKYLEKKGIEKERITGKGYGETMPLISGSTIDALPSKEAKEKAHAINRRTDITITGRTFTF